MAGGTGDVRKLFIFTTTQNYFGLVSEPWGQTLLYNSPEINNFLDDGNQMLLRVQRSDTGINFSNTIDFADTKDKVLVFFKLRPDVITDKNLHNNILVSSMLESPINSLYQAVRQVFAPVLLKDQEWSRNLDPKLQNLLSELEAGLGIVLRRSDTNLSKLKFKEDDTRGILTPNDEFQFWIEQAHRGNKQISKERANYFKELFETIAREFYNLDGLSLLEVVDLVETTRDVVDDVWRQTEHDHYPESRMLHLLDIIGGSFGRFVQKKLGTLNLWEDPYYLVKENMKAGISICEQWVMACNHLTGQVWQRYVPHPWKNEKYFPETLDKLGKRLEEVLAVRTIHEKILYFLPAGEEKITCLARVFEPFTGLNPVQYNPYTEPLWKAAVSQYEKIIAPAEQKIAGKLKNYISEIQDSPQQLLQAFLKYKELVKRPTLSKELMLERETLLARLVDSVKDFRLDFENRCRGIPGDATGPLSGKNLSEVVNNIVWVRQLELKVDDAIKIAEALLSDLSEFRSFHRNAEDLLDQFKLYEQEQFDDWSRDIQSGLSDSRSGLCIEANSQIMELDPNDGSLKVHYSDRLVILLREVRQLSALGFVIPAKIQQVANIAQKFCKQAIILKQVAHFYNSIDQQMIQSQRPMMLQSALAFEQIIKNSKAGSGGKSQITWDNPKELEGYIQKLQNAAERLATENRKLRKWHTTFCEKVVTLMNIDLLRQQQRWKDGLQELRTGLASVEAQGFQASDMRAWKQHWNHQLYKALEHQYQMGLEALNENLPEINIDLTYKQGRLQFRPPFEEIRAKYYREMKRFIGIPNQFKGVGETGDASIFSIMIDRNASGFLTIFSKAEDLFRRLSAVLHQHKEWIVIGQVDMEALVEKHLSTVHDWEKNFKALKIKGKEVERLPSAVKVDCLNINCSPVKTVIDDLIQKLFDMLVLSLKKSIQAHLHEIDTFVTEAMEVLSVMPQSVEEIGDANLQYSKLQERKPEILPLFQEAEDKNRLLRTVAGRGLETISNLKAKWDKFELMMESHQLMIKDQIEVMKGNVKSRLQIYYQELEKFKARWDQLKPGDDVIETGQQNTLDKSAKSIKEKKIEFDDLEIIRKKLVDDCHHFGLEEPDFSLAYSISKDIEGCAQMWALYEEFQQGFQEMANEDWITFRTKTYLFEEFLMNWHERLRRVEEHSVMTVKLQSEIDKYKIAVPILKYVRGEHLSPDHWLDLFRLLGLPRGTSLEKLVFGDLLRVADTIVAKTSDLKDLNSRAQGEVTIREALRELDLWGVGAVFTLIDYEDSQSRTIKLIKDWKDIVNQVGDNRCLLQSLKDSPYYKGFEDKVSIWERKLAELDEYLQNLNHIQRKWVYLEPIFGRGALPKEQTRFNRVDEDFRSIMTDIKKDNRVTTLTTHAGIRNSLLTILDQLQRCQKSLNEFLEEKRSAFPRFYFIGDDDLLEILGQSTNPSVIQSHLKKLFAGINSVCFDEESKHITAMKSLEGEVVPFKNKVLLSNNVEAWLNDLALEMKQTLKHLLTECLTTGQRSQGAIDPSLFPSQILCLAEHIKFTEDVENAIQDHSLHQIETQLVKKLEHYTNIDTSSEDPGNTESGILELKLKALILDIIHNIDVVKQLNQVQVHTTEDWAWKKQVRFYMKSDHTCCVQMVDSELQYTYEYQGNAPKLVYTPLTDKCYLTLTQAMKMGLGGNPYGPAGTGKTESVKALGGLLGRQVLVFNCDEGIDVKSMGRIFVGLVKCGAWGCFDEFNRLEESVLSAVSMQIQTIQDALKNHRAVCELLGKEVEINSNSGIFITMNPAGKGYGGRQKLPDNLKQLFRPVAMSRPDNELIAEVILYSEGFKDAKVLGRKLVAVFNLSRELLTPQQHYDWGLRALKTVLRGSGNLLRQLKKTGIKQKGLGSKSCIYLRTPNDYVVETSLVGTVMNGLSHLYGCKEHDQFIINLIRGLGGNLNMKSRLEFTKEVFNWAQESPPDPHKPMDTYYDSSRERLASYMLKKPENLTADDFSNGQTLPVIQTPHMQRGLDYFKPWLKSDTKQPFILVGPEGCGKGMLLRYAFSQLRSTQIATVHCSAQTTSQHLLQKLSQTCMVISTNTGRVYRPKDCERLVLYLKDINLPKLDKWGTSTLVAFLQQVLTYQGFYDENLEWVGLENIQIVASMSAGGRLGRHKLTTRFTSIVRLCAIDYPEREQLQTIYGAYLEPVLHKNLKNHSIWGSSSKIYLLAGSMVQVYEQVRAKFTVDDYSHYFFTPCILTQWVLGLFRYDLEGGSSKHPLDYVLEIVAYEARRLFRDKIVGAKELHLFDSILTSVFQGDWGSDILDNMADSFYVTWGARHDSGTRAAPGQLLPPHGKPLGKLNSADLKDVIRKGLIHYGRDNQNLDILLFQEVLEYISRIDRVLSFPGGSLLLAGRSGVGRRTITSLVSHMHGAMLFSPKISRGYELKQFKNDLKHVLHLAGIEAQQVVFLLEDYQFVYPTFLEMINSLLSSGEVPGLYTLEELEPLLLPLKDQASQDGFFGPVFNYFSYRIQQNLHIVLIMDCANLNFIINCESNPALHKKCQVLWMEGWSDSSMKKIPEMLFNETSEEKCSDKNRKEEKKKNSVDPDFLKSFLLIHESCKAYGATPSRYMTFLHVYSAINSSKKKELLKRQSHLQAGVSKLNEAKALVDELNRKAGEQSILLKMKQDEADAALQEITVSMQDASEQKTELERLKHKIAEEVVKIEERKNKIDDELKEVQPLVNEAKLAVGNIKPESLSEIRSLRMPPDVIRDILEGVLRLMGIFDTSWVSMKSFLAKRGVREDIATFDARNIPKEIRESVEELLFKNKGSFDPKNAKRASTAAAPLAAWVKANVQYSHVLERIHPLETEQAELESNLKKTEDRKRKLEELLNSVGQKVSELKEKFQSRTSEAAKLEAEVSKAQETIKAAEVLINQLDREHKRWNAQVVEITEELATLPKRAQLAAAFITYLSAAPEGLRKTCLEEWTKSACLEKFDLRRFLCTESEQLIWKSEGLPSDDLSIENAIVILQIIGVKSWSRVCPFLIDPSSQATEWLKTHLKDSRLEVINQQQNTEYSIQLIVSFKKIGPRYVVQIGDKIIDYNEEFRLFLSTRNPNPFIPPDAASIVTEVNFTTTRSGLQGQLLALTIQHEKPDLEEQKTKLLQQEEDKKIQLAKLEESLLETLATSQGNILENKDLIESLNQTKASSALIQESLKESYKLQIFLDQERDAYLPLAESASKMYFIISDLSKINNMYRFSLASFLRLFQRALQNKQDSENTEQRIQSLISSLKHMVYEYICHCLFKADQLMFALHFVRGMHPELFQENEWDTFTGVVVGDMLRKADSQQRIRDQLPSWIDQERSWAVATLKIALPSLYQILCFEDVALWHTFYHNSVCEQEFPPSLAKKVSLFHQVLVVQALRPDRLQSAMALFACKTLGLKELSPLPLNLKRLYKETLEIEPILIIISPGADPSQELQELANAERSGDCYHQVAMGQGQADLAIQMLKECAHNGDWLCLKNLHLVVSWLPVLEKELNTLQPKDTFRLWLTAEVHPNFTPILLQSSLKITYESPPGLKKNLMRTYESWTPEQISKKDNIHRAHALFSFAWFHAACQERRNYIPQGWTKFYEFSLSDLRAGYNIIDRLFDGTKDVQWEFVHGLLENAIYGGRIDNYFDLRVLQSYLKQFFNSSIIDVFNQRNKNSIFPYSLSLPKSCSILDYRAVIEKLPEDDKPSFFGLPANIARSSQRMISSQVISQLRILGRSVTAGCKFDREIWSNELSPVLNLWKKLNQNSNLIHLKVSPPNDRQGSPILSFIVLEQFNAIHLVQSVHQSLAALSKVIRGTTLLSSEVQKLASALLNQKCPLTWQSKWEGPEDPLQYLRGLVARALAIQSWVERAEKQALLSDTLDLSELFHPDTFLNALRQETARASSCSVDSLKFVASWKGRLQEAKLQIKISGLLLEGCSFDGNRLSENQHDSPSVSSVLPCFMGWIPQGSYGPYSPDECISLPVYTSAERDRVVTNIDVPCGGSQDQWIQCGAALFLKNQ
ncbi:PREDICTED: cytoplasmic dynein 2 heavy chain 1 [Hipposideros armiger]|uniref:Cytoplasmic dynein 2 heavy chain 1 n=1 Tax=Hipposideros armiger TaxID=186990 RepID=A0A8B7T5V1_HIPAR|nr:PREDICTED: cytoplasmic dynein 2 heavy chain 1 [Hipposideros armiger]